MAAAFASSPLIRVDELAAAAPDTSIRIVDTRWKLGSPDAGRLMFESGHIRGATYLDMDRDMAAAPGERGRHPLPAASDFAEAMSRAGIGPGTTVVAYDDGDGLGAARLWWLLRHFGHDAVVVLDGGFPAWQAAAKPVEAGPGQTLPRGRFDAHPRANDVMDTEAVRKALQQREVHVLDARTPERFRGEIEPVDSTPGRIPGSRNAPAGANVRDGRFRTPAELRAHYESLGVLDGKPIVASCGSGVTACVDLLGLELAGVPGARLYPGSYSGWLAKGLPTETG
jgi:thiosulfate/3-mercaptopyruvate sulfurtransferase